MSVAWSGFYFRGSLHTKDRDLAEARAYEVEHQLRSRDMGVHDESMTVEAVTAALRSELTERGRSKSYIDRVICRARFMLSEASDLKDVTPEYVERRLADLRRAGKSARTVTHHKDALRLLFKWLMRAGRWGVNPLLPAEEHQSVRWCRACGVANTWPPGPWFGKATKQLDEWDNPIKEKTWLLKAKANLKRAQESLSKRSA